MDAIRESLFTLSQQYLPEPHSSLINGIVYGVDLYTKGELYDNLKHVGLLHIVVLSGMNITLLASCIILATSKLTKRVSLMITIVGIICFVVFVGFDAPIIRAALMAIFTIIGIYFNRQTSALFGLLLSFLVIALIWPQWLSTISLQLSYGASLGILLFGRSTHKSHTFISTIWDELRITLSAQIFTAPIIFLYFKQISLISPIANLLISPFIGPLMVIGLVGSCMHYVFKPIAFLLYFCAYGIISILLLIIEILVKAPYGYLSF